MAGTGKRVVLVDCRHDKYGGRITCDVITDRGHSAAEEILRTGLAIPYFGKRKTHNWCDLPDILPDVKDPLYQHLFSCGWEGIIKSTIWMTIWRMMFSYTSTKMKTAVKGKNAILFIKLFQVWNEFNKIKYLYFSTDFDFHDVSKLCKMI